tara:strand:+ start:259 stop:462 length:204 start_codon:yes stop_codon:yes gene_type:complete
MLKKSKYIAKIETDHITNILCNKGNNSIDAKNIILYLNLFSKKIFKNVKIAKLNNNNWKGSLNVTLV